MGLAKKLRITVEEVVRKYVGEQLDDLQNRVAALEDGSRQAIEALERQTTKALAKIAFFLTNEGHYNCNGLSPDATADVVIDLLKDAFGTSEHESLVSQVNRLANFIMDEIPGEPSKNEGTIDTAIRAMKDLLAYPRAAPTDLFGHFTEIDYSKKRDAPVVPDASTAWSPMALGHLMSKANPNSGKLPNEVRVRLDRVGDVTMLVRKSDLPNATAQGVLIVNMPVPGGTLNILAPADVPTRIMDGILGKQPHLGGAEYVKARIFDRRPDMKDWLPEHATIEFPRWHIGLPLGDTVELYGEHAAELALIGHTFVEVQIMPLPEESPAPPADPPAPSPSP